MEINQPILTGVFAQLTNSNRELETSLNEFNEACERLHRMNGDGRKIREELRSRLVKLVVQE